MLNRLAAGQGHKKRRLKGEKTDRVNILYNCLPRCLHYSVEPLSRLFFVKIRTWPLAYTYIGVPILWKWLYMYMIYGYFMCGDID